MEKKLNLLIAIIKTLLKNKLRPIDITRKLKISKRKVTKKQKMQMLKFCHALLFRYIFSKFPFIKKNKIL